MAAVGSRSRPRGDAESGFAAAGPGPASAGMAAGAGGSTGLDSLSSMTVASREDRFWRRKGLREMTQAERAALGVTGHRMSPHVDRRLGGRDQLPEGADFDGGSIRHPYARRARVTAIFIEANSRFFRRRVPGGERVQIWVHWTATMHPSSPLSTTRYLWLNPLVHCS